MSEEAEIFDPLDPEKGVSEPEGLKAIIDQSKQCQLDWSDVNDINSEAVDAVGTLMQIAAAGDESAVEMLRDLAVGITRHLHEHHRDSMRKCYEFPVVLWAEIDHRKKQLDSFRLLPIGIEVGFPTARQGARPPKTGKSSPSNFWREVQFCLQMIRMFSSAPEALEGVYVGKQKALNVPNDLLDRVARLQDFDSRTGENDPWLEAALQLVELNAESLIPDWITNRVTSGKKSGKQRQNPWETELRKGFRYCRKVAQK